MPTMAMGSSVSRSASAGSTGKGDSALPIRCPTRPANVGYSHTSVGDRRRPTCSPSSATRRAAPSESRPYWLNRPWTSMLRGSISRIVATREVSHEVSASTDRGSVTTHPIRRPADQASARARDVGLLAAPSMAPVYARMRRAARCSCPKNPPHTPRAPSNLGRDDSSHRAVNR